MKISQFLIFISVTLVCLSSCSRKEKLETVTRHHKIDNEKKIQVVVLEDIKTNQDKEGDQVIEKKRSTSKKPIVVESPLPDSASSQSRPNHRFMLWPADGVITSEFGNRNHQQHNGIDILYRENRDIRAVADGMIVFSDWNGKLGKTIIIKHNNGLKTVYSHLSKRFVTTGMQVWKGKRIAQMGSTGKSTGVHLHFEVHVKGKPVDPVLYLPER